MGLSVEDFASMSAVLVYGAHRFMLRGCAFYGWDETAWQRTAQPTLAQWRQWLS